MKLQQLYIEKESLEEVKKYLTDFLTEEGVKRMFEGADDTWEVGAAKRLLDKAFDNLEALFGSKTKKKKEVKNQAR